MREISLLEALFSCCEHRGIEMAKALRATVPFLLVRHRAWDGKKFSREKELSRFVPVSPGAARKTRAALAAALRERVLRSETRHGRTE